jgi:hypothetical protein
MADMRRTTLIIWMQRNGGVSNYVTIFIGGPFEKFVDWRHCAAVMQREAVIVCRFVVVGVT